MTTRLIHHTVRGDRHAKWVLPRGLRKNPPAKKIKDHPAKKEKVHPERVHPKNREKVHPEKGEKVHPEKRAWDQDWAEKTFTN